MDAEKHERVGGGLHYAIEQSIAVLFSASEGDCITAFIVSSRGARRDPELESGEEYEERAAPQFTPHFHLREKSRRQDKRGNKFFRPAPCSLVGVSGKITNILSSEAAA